MQNSWLFLLFLILENFENFMCQYCNETIIEPETIWKTETYTSYRTFRKWYGKIDRKSFTLTRTVPVTEYKTIVKKVCCPGYEISRKLCVPSCDKFCENSNCTAPNTCTCYPGYMPFNDFRCIPECTDCRNGFCTAPEICICYAGYEKDENNICQVKCSKSCINGDCTHPEHCTCHNGYELIKETFNECQPICNESCLFGDCIGPDNCKCWKGYEKNNSTKCQPKCYNCQNGHCIAPDICKCIEGYEKDSNEICQPICDEECINGVCTNNTFCYCNKGFKISENIPFKCIPICKNDCLNGKCIEPNICICPIDYILNENTGACELLISTTISESKQEHFMLENQDNDNFTMTDIYQENICYPDCIGGICKQGKCDCLEGYIHLDENTNECIPICEENCWNGICSNGICYCNDGYQRNNGSECKPICSLECVGYCIEPNLCECWDGYVLDYNETSRNQCIPLCDHDEDGCVNGTCIQPDICKCNEGYIKSQENRFICIEDINGTNTICLDCNQNYQKADQQNFIFLYITVSIIMLVCLAGGSFYFYRNYKRRIVYNVGVNEKQNGVVRYSCETEKIAVI